MKTFTMGMLPQHRRNPRIEDACWESEENLVDALVHRGVPEDCAQHMSQEDRFTLLTTSSGSKWSFDGSTLVQEEGWVEGTAKRWVRDRA